MKADKLQKILLFQKAEIEIKTTEKAIEKVKSQTEELVKVLEELREKRENLLKRIQEVQKEIKNHQLLIEDCKKKARQAEERLNLVKKAEEYRTLMKEKARHEDCVIKLSSSLRSLEEELKRLQEEKDNKKSFREMQELEEELSDLRYSYLRLENRLRELEANLKDLKTNTEQTLIEEYERLKRRYGLPFVFPIDSFGACTNCGTKLPSALYSQLIGGEVVTCPTCGRLVYYEETL